MADRKLLLFRTNQGNFVSISSPEVELDQIKAITFRDIKDLKITEIIELDVGAFKVDTVFHYGKVLPHNSVGK